MLDLSTLLAPGESESALHAVIQEWQDKCKPSNDREQEVVDAGVSADWFYQRKARLYQALRDPSNIQTDARELSTMLRHCRHLAKTVQRYKNWAGFDRGGR